jgi:hypothetical protein
MFLNICAGWIGFLVGIIAGAISGMKFHDENFLGGYASWKRRLIRLAHISFFGLALINLAFAVTVDKLGYMESVEIGSISLVVGLITMPLVCYLAAFRPAFRHLFAIPVVSVLVGVVNVLWILMK